MTTSPPASATKRLLPDPCGACRIVTLPITGDKFASFAAPSIQFCNLHASAKEMQAALRDAVAWLEGLDPEADKATDGLGEIRAALAASYGPPG